MATLVTTPIKTFVSGETVTPTKLNELSQSTVALTAGTIVAADIATDAVTTAKILDANVTTAKLADSAVTTAKVNDSAVTTAKINNAAVTAAKLDGAQTGSAPIYGCRAWVNFDGMTVTNVGGENRCTIRASGNVSKVVRTNAGAYVVHFATALPSNACVVGNAHGGGGGGIGDVNQWVSALTPTTTTCDVFVCDVGNTFTDTSAVNVAFIA